MSNDVSKVAEVYINTVLLVGFMLVATIFGGVAHFLPFSEFPMVTGVGASTDFRGKYANDEWMRRAG